MTIPLPPLSLPPPFSPVISLSFSDPPLSCRELALNIDSALRIRIMKKTKIDLLYYWKGGRTASVPFLLALQILTHNSLPRPSGDVVLLLEAAITLVAIGGSDPISQRPLMTNRIGGSNQPKRTDGSANFQMPSSDKIVKKVTNCNI